MAKARLRRDASGVAHVRWGGQILATIDAHARLNKRLDQAQRDELRKEGQLVAAKHETLCTATNAYRAFNDGAYTKSRAEIAVGDYLCDEAQKAVDAHARLHRETVERALPGGMRHIRGELALSQILRVGAERTAQLAVEVAAMVRGLPASVPGTAALADALQEAGGMLQGLVDRQRKEIDPQRVPLRSAVERGIFELREALEQMDGRLRTHFTEAFIDSLYPEIKRGSAAQDDEDEDGADPL